MVTEEEIRRVAGLMKISIGDHTEYIDKVNSMIGYFEILDSAGAESEEVSFQEAKVSGLREDAHIPFEGDLIGMLKNYKGAFVRAPKMSS